MDGDMANLMTIHNFYNSALILQKIHFRHIN